MNDPGLYRELLLEHFHHPRHRGEVAGMAHVRRGANPRCGDEVEVGVDTANGRLEAVRFRARGCSICIASASMMSESLTGVTVAEALSICTELSAWFSTDSGNPPPSAIGEPLTALTVVQEHPARRRCALLAWEALADALRGEA